MTSYDQASPIGKALASVASMGFGTWRRTIADYRRSFEEGETVTAWIGSSS